MVPVAGWSANSMVCDVSWAVVVCRAVKFADVGIGFGIIVVSVKFDFIYRNSFGQVDDVFYSGRIFDAFDGRESCCITLSFLVGYADSVGEIIKRRGAAGRGARVSVRC